MIATLTAMLRHQQLCPLVSFFGIDIPIGFAIAVLMRLVSPPRTNRIDGAESALDQSTTDDDDDEQLDHDGDDGSSLTSIETMATHQYMLLHVLTCRLERASFLGKMLVQALWANVKFYATLAKEIGVATGQLAWWILQWIGFSCVLIPPMIVVLFGECSLGLAIYKFFDQEEHVYHDNDKDYLPFFDPRMGTWGGFFLAPLAFLTEELATFLYEAIVRFLSPLERGGGDPHSSFVIKLFAVSILTGLYFLLSFFGLVRLPDYLLAIALDKMNPEEEEEDDDMIALNRCLGSPRTRPSPFSGDAIPRRVRRRIDPYIPPLNPRTPLSSGMVVQVESEGEKIQRRKIQRAKRALAQQREMRARLVHKDATLHNR